MNEGTRCWAVIPAAGRGERMGAAQGLPKQYLPLAGATVIEHAVRPFLDHPGIAGIVVVLSERDERWQSLVCSRHPAVLRAPGGRERVHSVLNGLTALEPRAHPDDWVLVHDAARPCLARADLDRLIGQLRDDPVGGLLALPVSDTLKRAVIRAATDTGAIAETATIATTVDRHGLWRAQTPQMFHFGRLKQALEQAVAGGGNIEKNVTDEAAAIEALGLQPRLVEGSVRNIKITRPEDLALAAAILGENAVTLRTGSGYDVHAFGPGDHVMLGGVRIPHDKGVRAHSDGDVVIHALCDALLGAAGLGDIGQHFPDSDPRWKGAASAVFLERVVEMLGDLGYRVVNADVTVLAESPRLGSHREAMKNTLAASMGIAKDSVNIKATTYEGLGALGRKEGIAAQAAVLIKTV